MRMTAIRPGITFYNIFPGEKRLTIREHPRESISSKKSINFSLIAILMLI